MFPAVSLPRVGIISVLPAIRRLSQSQYTMNKSEVEADKSNSCKVRVAEKTCATGTCAPGFDLVDAEDELIDRIHLDIN